ncbi:phosphoserine phosphatase SerB [Candidatus Sulfidibacterium hydrothermale]|uniref:phosphoserine phosphatase SerB n=1 Tax=Candidatus Sulfidibacterium hydrothermale TaxID=2875962 RepID=UPI001F0A8F52|nr:phosphoserine phosphatase SerB [Candidatus Sulfidibacterium hydrothermale]UBM62408.1 phosphoserine phosphatase SerB [Candidatus Sulfidibacterium hydrothermale]
MAENNNEIILLNISGKDKPGLTASLMEVLSQYNVNILDMGQSVIHQDLGLGILFEVPKESKSSSILKDLLFKAYELNTHISFTPIPLEQYEEWVSNQGKERYLITVLAPRLTASDIAQVARVIVDQNLNIDTISRLSGRKSLKKKNKVTKAVVEFSVRGTPVDVKAMKQALLTIASKSDFDIAFQEDNVFRRTRRLVCFDMDSTLIQTEVIDELAVRAGVGDKVKEITASAMRGEIDFKESFRKRVALLKGLDESVLKEIAENLPITEGAERLLRTLKQYGYRTAILSGGFTYFGNYLKNKLGIDYVFANELEIKNGKLTGRHLNEIVDGQRKAQLLELLAFKEDIHLEQVIAVGDGANDLPMLEKAGMGIAFHAKPTVKASAQHAISVNGLDTILYLLGFRDREINE